MAKVAPKVIQGCFGFGLGFIAIMTALILSTIFGLVSITNSFLKAGICLSTILCFTSFTIPTAILYHVQSELQGFGAIVRIEKGDVTSQCVGALVCSGVMVLLTTVVSFII